MRTLNSRIPGRQAGRRSCEGRLRRSEPISQRLSVSSPHLLLHPTLPHRRRRRRQTSSLFSGKVAPRLSRPASSSEDHFCTIRARTARTQQPLSA